MPIFILFTPHSPATCILSHLCLQPLIPLSSKYRLVKYLLKAELENLCKPPDLSTKVTPLSLPTHHNQSSPFRNINSSHVYPIRTLPDLYFVYTQNLTTKTTPSLPLTAHRPHSKLPYPKTPRPIHPGNPCRTSRLLHRPLYTHSLLFSQPLR